MCEQRGKGCRRARPLYRRPCLCCSWGSSGGWGQTSNPLSCLPPWAVGAPTRPGALHNGAVTTSAQGPEPRAGPRTPAVCHVLLALVPW